MSESNQKSVALYARVSTLHNGQDPEVQLRELRASCERRGFMIKGEYIDKGISGSRERRDVDIDSGFTEALRDHVGTRISGRVFEARNGSPISPDNLRKSVLHPILLRLGIPKAGFHAFRHGRVTMLRKRGTPKDLQTLWIGHSSLRTTDRYSHTDQGLEYRRVPASKAGLSFVVGPNGPNLGSAAGQ